MQESTAKEPSMVVLAYSGGLDTSIILHWLKHVRKLEVTTFTAEIGQGEDTQKISNNARAGGASDIIMEDLREEFVSQYVFPMLRANTIYEGEYLLGTAIARPLISKRLVAIADLKGADAIVHGATGKGNDQLRFELSAYALNPKLQIIAPWREWDMTSRSELLAYACANGIQIQKDSNKPPYSIDANLLHTSYEGEELEDPWVAPKNTMWQHTTSVHDAPANEIEVCIEFIQGDPVAVDGRHLSAAKLLTLLNEVAGRHAIGRSDIVENRTIGIKSRGCYETPGGTLLLKAHRALESITLDREAAHLKDCLMPRYAETIYNGLWWSPERRMLQALIDESQQHVTGEVRLHLCKGRVAVTGRRSPSSLYSKQHATFEGETSEFSHADASGFIKLHGLRLRAHAERAYRLSEKDT